MKAAFMPEHGNPLRTYYFKLIDYAIECYREADDIYEEAYDLTICLENYEKFHSMLKDVKNLWGKAYAYIESARLLAGNFSIECFYD